MIKEKELIEWLKETKQKIMGIHSENEYNRGARMGKLDLIDLILMKIKEK